MSDDVKKVETELKTVISGLCSTFVAEHRSRAIELLGSVREAMDAGDRYGALGFNREVMVWLDEALRVVVDDQIVRRDAPAVNEGKLRFAYRNLNVIERHVRRLVEARNKGGCSGDWTRTIIDAYVESITTGKYTVFNEDKYYIPKFGTFEEWMSLCSSVEPLLNGDPTAYMCAYDDLATAEIRVYPHTRHNWYARFKNNEKVLIDTTWDDRDEATQYARVVDGHYELPVHAVRDLGYAYSGDDMLGRCTCDVPVDDVVRIFKTSKVVNV